MAKLEVGDRVRNIPYDENGYPCCAPFKGTIIAITSLANRELCYVVKFDGQKDDDDIHYGFLKEQLIRITKAINVSEKVNFI